jgi:Tol biopolymer transport system component
MKNAITTGLLSISLIAALTSCHDSVETFPTSNSSKGKLLYSQVDFLHYAGKAYPVVTADLDGTNPHVIAQGLSLSAGSGKVLYVVSHGEFQDNISISNDDGTGAKVLYTIDTATGRDLQWMPVLSPDGSKVVYGFTSSSQDMVDVKVQDVATGVMTTIDRVVKSETLPGFSPDGKNVVYYNASWVNQGSGQLKIAATDGSWARVLTSVEDPGVDGIGRIAWRPGTNQIAYFDHDSTYIISSDGSNKRLLVPGVTCAWSHDGQQLDYAGEELGADVFVTSDLGMTSTNITHSGSVNEAYPVWSPDGKTIYALWWAGDYDHTTQSLIAVDVASKSSRAITTPAQQLFITK